MDMKAGMLEPRNIYRNYTLSLYLAVTPKRLNMLELSCIDPNTSVVSRCTIKKVCSFLNYS